MGLVLGGKLFLWHSISLDSFCQSASEVTNYDTSSENVSRLNGPKRVSHPVTVDGTIPLRVDELRNQNLGILPFYPNVKNGCGMHMSLSAKRNPYTKEPIQTGYLGCLTWPASPASSGAVQFYGTAMGLGFRHTGYRTV